MDAITKMLTDMMGPLGPVIAVGGLGLLLVVVAVLPMILNNREDPIEKLKRSKDERASGETKQKLRTSSGGSDKLQRYAAFLEPQDKEEYSAMQLKLLQAGYPGKNAVRTFHFAQFALGIGFLVLGHMAPKYWVTRRVETRKEEIVNGFPDALDMMLVCVEAGQSLDQSILRVSKEIRSGFPALAEEFEIVNHELKAGKDRLQVLRDLGTRAGVPDVASLVTVLIQSTTVGTSIAEALRVYAAEMRDKRVMRAEEKANKLPTKMTLATMLLTLPPLLIILIGPSLYEVYNTLNNLHF
ncbi:MAG: type II secretion system F family protein [Maritimibacter sp.]